MVKTYVFKAELQEEDDGRWSAWVDALPGCAAWGYTEDEALRALRDAVEIYVEDMVESGEEVPKEGVQVIETPAVAVSL